MIIITLSLVSTVMCLRLHHIESGEESDIMPRWVSEIFDCSVLYNFSINLVISVPLANARLLTKDPFHEELPQQIEPS